MLAWLTKKFNQYASAASIPQHEEIIEKLQQNWRWRRFPFPFDQEIVGGAEVTLFVFDETCMIVYYPDYYYNDTLIKKHWRIVNNANNAERFVYTLELDNITRQNRKLARELEEFYTFFTR